MGNVPTLILPAITGALMVWVILDIKDIVSTCLSWRHKKRRLMLRVLPLAGACIALMGLTVVRLT